MISKERVVPGREVQDLNSMIQKLTIGNPYEIKNLNELRNLDLNNCTIGDIARILGTLIQDMKNKGLIIAR